MSTALERRREQNRKAQRKHRSKVRELIKSRSNQGSSETSETSLISSSIIFRSDSPNEVETFIPSLLLSASSPVKSSRICLPRLQLVQALNNNAERMGIPNTILTNYWSISTIQQGWQNKSNQDYQIQPTPNKSRSKTCLTVEDYQSISTWRFDRIPENMLPNQAQLSIEHHPYIDCVFPWSSMRSKILLLMETVFTEEQLCQETLTAHERYGEPAFTIWGDDPMDENSWEISQSFASNWWFLLDRKIINRTNWWRRQQEKPELKDVCVLD